MNAHFGDRLVAAIGEKNAPACVGLDPLVERLPTGLRDEFKTDATGDHGMGAGLDRETIAGAILAYGRGVIEAVAAYVPAIKINIAFFERYYMEGIRVYYQLARDAHDAGLIVIGDVKRADIGHSTTQYAEAQLGGPDSVEVGQIATPDAVTVNPYFGFDAIRPFVDIAKARGRGLFVLVQTSNESANQVQGLPLEDGSTLGEHVGQLVQTWAAESSLIGTSGYSCIGAVVSPRDPDSTRHLRTLMPNCLFLVPGFGAQGRTADEVAKCFKPDGTGAIVNASRSVIYAYENARYQEAGTGDWRGAIARACREFVATIRSVPAK